MNEIEIRLEKLERKFEVLDHFDKLKVFNERLERIEIILTRLIEIEFENYHVSPYDDDILQKLYKRIKKGQNGKGFEEMTGHERLKKKLFGSGT